MAEKSYKIVLAGEHGVGKSSILRQLQREAQGVDEKVARSGRNHEKLRTRVDIEDQNEPVLVDLWDTVDMERHGSQNVPSRSYFVGTHGVILVYDKERHETLTALNMWIENAKEFSNVKEGKLIFSLWGNQTGGTNTGSEEDPFVKGYATARNIPEALIFSVNLASKGLMSTFREVVQAVHKANTSLTTSGRVVTLVTPAGSTVNLVGDQQEAQADGSNRRRFKCCG